MITYNDIYKAAENNPLVFFNFPQSTERRFLIALDEIASLLQEVNIK
ncbi:hypothetical protein HY212_06535 [Candidatus Pacearchaeota archaeon]|nr:hypothetical protein [Candidatus Pacearchaeota archaeon]